MYFFEKMKFCLKSIMLNWNLEFRIIFKIIKIFMYN